MGKYRIKKVCNIDGCKYIPQGKGFNTNITEDNSDPFDAFLLILVMMLIVFTAGLLLIAYYVSTIFFWQTFTKGRLSSDHYIFDTEEEAKYFIEKCKQRVIDYDDEYKKDKLRKKKTTTYINQ